MQGRIIQATAAHEAFRREVVDLLKKHTEAMPREEVLAVAAQIVGQIMAMQDQTKMTTLRAQRIIERNITIGHATVVGQLHETKGTA